MKQIKLDVHYTEKLIEVRWTSPMETLKQDMSTMPIHENQIVGCMAQTIEWLKMTAKKQNQEIKVYFNSKLVIDSATEKTLQTN